MIVLQSSALTAHILPRGATLAGLWLKGHPRSLVLGFADQLAFESAAFYAGALVGPVANRVSGGQIRIGGKTFQMPRNEHPNCLHSGDGGLNELIWDVSDQTLASVTLTLELPDCANGLPGTRKISATYALTELDTLSLTITALSDCDTPMNVAHHPYWTLDCSQDISGHFLQVNATDFLPVNEQMIPTGQIMPVARSKYDFRAACPVPVDQALDANLCISSIPSDVPQDVAVLKGSDGITLHIASTEPGLQVYNGSGLPTDGPTALPGQRIQPFAGIALEPQGWPDAPNHPHFPSVMLPRDGAYRQETHYRITKD
ncbi:MAG: aldose epimerase family protein [Paracoccaceae bacterium]|nr:aldose epimerase family protein [Paracoccaceae bacterium]